MRNTINNQSKLGIKYNKIINIIGPKTGEKNRLPKPTTIGQTTKTKLKIIKSRIPNEITIFFLKKKSQFETKRFTTILSEFTPPNRRKFAGKHTGRTGSSSRVFGSHSRVLGHGALGFGWVAAHG
jgi:hypothetical protein